MWQSIRTNAVAFHASFHRSGVIVFARLQTFLGIVFTVLTVTDLSSWLPSKWLTVWLVGSGILTEYIRKSGSEVNEENHLVPRRDDNTVNVTVVNSASTAAAPAPASPLGPTDGSTK